MDSLVICEKHYTEAHEMPTVPYYSTTGTVFAAIQGPGTCHVHEPLGSFHTSAVFGPKLEVESTARSTVILFFNTIPSESTPKLHEKLPQKRQHLKNKKTHKGTFNGLLILSNTQIV